jgi:hypothetical protein
MILLAANQGPVSSYVEESFISWINNLSRVSRLKYTSYLWTYILETKVYAIVESVVKKGKQTKTDQLDCLCVHDCICEQQSVNRTVFENLMYPVHKCGQKRIDVRKLEIIVVKYVRCYIARTHARTDGRIPTVAVNSDNPYFGTLSCVVQNEIHPCCKMKHIILFLVMLVKLTATKVARDSWLAASM